MLIFQFLSPYCALVLAHTLFIKMFCGNLCSVVRNTLQDTFDPLQWPSEYPSQKLHLLSSKISGLENMNSTQKNLCDHCRKLYSISSLSEQKLIPQNRNFTEGRIICFLSACYRNNIFKCWSIPIDPFVMKSSHDLKSSWHFQIMWKTGGGMELRSFALTAQICDMMNNKPNKSFYKFSIYVYRVQIQSISFYTPIAVNVLKVHLRSTLKNKYTLK